jgi:enoyl-CoA hydratase/carnithine racemase
MKHEFETLALRQEDDLLWLTLQRPEQLNAFTVQMCEELIACFDAISRDDSVRAVIVIGAGRAFCAGMDLDRPGNVFGLDETQVGLSPAELEARYDDPAIVHGVRDTGGRVAMAIQRCTKPVIGAINGPAVGIGATMTLSMDVRIAAERARFGFVFARVGIVPEACSTWLLPKLVGVSQALEWFYRADVFDAQEALRGGLVREVVPAEALHDRARAVARSFIDGKSSVSLALIRHMVLSHLGAEDMSQPHKTESLAVLHTSCHDGREGVAAFREKRPPAFTASVSRDLPAWYPRA